MEAWFSDIFKALGLVGIGSAAGTFLAKALLKHSLDRDLANPKSQLDKDLELHKSELKRLNDTQIEQFKSSLQRVAIERQIVFSKLHEHRAEVIAKCYSMLWDLAYSAQRIPFIAENADYRQQVRNQWVELS